MATWLTHGFWHVSLHLPVTTCWEDRNPRHHALHLWSTEYWSPKHVRILAPANCDYVTLRGTWQMWRNELSGNGEIILNPLG